MMRQKIESSLRTLLDKASRQELSTIEANLRRDCEIALGLTDAKSNARRPDRLRATVKGIAK